MATTAWSPLTSPELAGELPEVETTEGLYAESQGTPLTREGIRKMEALAAKYRQIKPQLDISPLMALTDTWTGSKLASSYNKPQSEEENIKENLGIEKTIQDARAKEGALISAALQMSAKANLARERLAANKGKVNDFVDNRQDARDEVAHRLNVRSLKSNPMVRQRANQYQNLSNALSIISDAETLTPQQIHEFQQAIRGNLGIKGTSGVGEREETYFKSLGLSAKNWEQFLTGDPANISKDSHLVKHLKDLAGVEQRNIKGQTEKYIQGLTGGHGSIYKRRPDLKKDINDLVTEFSDASFPDVPASQPAPTSAVAPSGKVKMVHPQSGKTVLVPANQVDQALKERFRRE